ncbi:hypothetical protein [Companilactobacillus sp. HBUAS59544]|uniref:hypothetical protein n=1 Tax=Companilactobacillus sp. HBUAS59544 TaxID=3109363 RepID=UPI002FF17BCD
MKLQLLNQDKVLDEEEDDGFVSLSYTSQYAQGNYYRLTLDHYPAFVWIQLEACIAPSLIYITKKNWDYTIPFNLQREWPYPDGAFLGKNHYSWARLATAEELKNRVNLAINTYDQHDENGAFPHASANAETRNETVFFAKNAIDGICANKKHGSYPFQSWGVDRREDAEFTLDFGRLVEIDQINFVLRADYPHDVNWSSIEVRFSDDSSERLALIRTRKCQEFPIAKRQVKWLKLTKLKRIDNTDAFPALSQLEVYGRNVDKKL